MAKTKNIEGSQLPLEARATAVNEDIKDTLLRNKIKIVFRPIIAPNGTITAVSELADDSVVEEPKKAETV